MSKQSLVNQHLQDARQAWDLSPAGLEPMEQHSAAVDEYTYTKLLSGGLARGLQLNSNLGLRCLVAGNFRSPRETHHILGDTFQHGT
jgi:hypothetical protein